MWEFLTASLQGIGQFCNMYLIRLLWIIFAFLMLRFLMKSENGKKWLLAQFEWLKLFFSEDKLPNAPSHKNLIGLAMTAVFCVAFMKKIVSATDVPDIPPGWQIVILGILGIRAIQSAAEKFAGNGNGKNGNGNSNGNGVYSITVPPNVPITGSN